MILPLLSWLFAIFALSLYVLLDGFDLGVGVLLLCQRDEGLRDRMVYSIMPTWDGNETWLIMAGVTLLAAFPIAYGILLPALYLPAIAMLLALGLRGVSFEFRYQTVAARKKWDAIFGFGSIMAAAMQGVILGALIQGIDVSGERFSGSVLDVVRPFPCLVGLVAVNGYLVLGSAWLRLKGTGDLKAFAVRSLRIALLVFVALVICTAIASALVQPAVGAAWNTRSAAIVPLGAYFLIVAALLMFTASSSFDLIPFLLALLLVALFLAFVGIVVYPDIVPFRLTLWQAASSTRSHLFLLVGALFVTPVILGYSAFAYRVFRGKTPVEGWDP
jgi:cytochrome bd ubiquinol oxidase subunit II